ncbi:MAG: DUF1311 domain-containing protein [Ignavibacteria bacterium]|nr:DUF1311 domain-containing protein [Ignavibacteria bacterium]
MRIIIFILCAVSVLSSSFIYSQEIKHPIDAYLDSCIDRNPSTFSMVNCIESAIQRWDDELNRFYKLLTGVLDEESAKILKSAEIEWIKYKEKEMANIEMIYSRLEGTMYIPMKYYAKLEVIRTRALQIADYYRLITEEES